MTLNYRSLRLPSLMVSIIFLLIFVCTTVPARAQQTENVVLITLDGLRWQELFSGADPLLITHPDYVQDTTALHQKFWRESPETRREVLMPFFTNTLARKGQVYGNRQENSMVNLTNRHWFSYPGYNEILTGYSDDDRIDSNDKIPNPNRTVLEHLNEQAEFSGRVAAFGSWDVFPYIINEERSGVPVNAGYEASLDTPLTDMEKAINTLQAEIPGHWPTVRMDAFTHHYALEYMKKHHPRVLYVAYGETDDFAHDGRYDHYLEAAHRTDRFIQDLWEFVQSDAQYRDKTTLIITTDHGRGTEPLDTWRSHGEDISGADEVWLAIMGPDTPQLPADELEGQYYSSQIAPTLAAFLKASYQADRQTGTVLKKAMR
jgi:hypothetical protein